MANKVFANNREVACKAANGKTICAFPDVCLSPPSPPAGPIPVPYPNTGLASDMTDGSKHVKISGKEVMLKDKSYFKKSTGDEAATKSLGMGVVTHQIQGKVYFTSWSMDVKIEGENVVRHLDLTTHNHASKPGQTPPWAYFDEMTATELGNCKSLKEAVETHCGDAIKKNTASTGRVNRTGAMKDMCDKGDCEEATECMLVEYGGSGSPNCCPGKTGHHLLPVHCFMPPGARKAGGAPYPDWPEYAGDSAPTLCVKGSGKELDHGQLHEKFDKAEDSKMVGGKAGSWSYGEARDKAAETAQEVMGCAEACTKAQLDAAHRKSCKDENLDSSQLRADSTGKRTPAGFTPQPSTTTSGAAG